MKKTLLALSVIAATSAQAEHHKKVELSDVDKCYMNAVEKYPGHVLSMESEIEKDRLIYEFDIMTKDGREVEVECDAKNHTLHDFEVEYKKGDKAFTNAAKISESEAFVKDLSPFLYSTSKSCSVWFFASHSTSTSLPSLVMISNS